jgi:hypothetical protein
LGDCSDTQSREHYISKGLFGEGSVKLKGLPWCKTEEVTIGLASAAAKILCKRHNERLSPLDDEAIKTFDSLREAFRLQEIQKKLPPRVWCVRHYRINGRILERWFLKTFVNLVMVQTEDMSWPNGTAQRMPTNDVVEACFGMVPIVSPRGLHAAAAVGQNVYSHDYVSFAPIVDRGINALAGGAFEFRGLRLLLSWTDRDLEPYINPLGRSASAFAGWRDSKLLHPFEGMNFDVGGHRSQNIKISWPPFKPLQ